MSEQPKEQNQKKRAVRQREPHASAPDRPAAQAPSTDGESAATAALALAVTTAQKSASAPAETPASAALDAEPVVEAPGRALGAVSETVQVRPYVIAAAVALLALVGGFAGTQFLAGASQPD